MSEFPYTEKNLDRIINAAGGFPSHIHARCIPTNDNARFDSEFQKCGVDTSDLKAECYESVDPRDALRDRLKQALEYHDIGIAHDAMFPRSQKQMVECFGKIEAAAQHLLAALEASDGRFQSIPDQFIWGGLSEQTRSTSEKMSKPPRFLVEQAFHGVVHFRDWAQGARLSAEERGLIQREDRHAGDETLQGLVESFYWIYADIFWSGKKAPYPSLNREKPGPLIQFMKACLEPLYGNKTPSDSKIQGRVRTHLEKTGLKGKRQLSKTASSGPNHRKKVKSRVRKRAKG